MAVVDPRPSPKQAVEQIGREYVETGRLPGENTKRAETLYLRVEKKVRSLYDHIPVPVVFQEADPYDSYADMARTVGQEQQLRVYNQHTDHPYFTHTGQLAFRAVHDWYGHLEADVNFSPSGEFRKFEHMRQYFTRSENRVLLAEVVGQVGAVHYLPDGFEDSRYEQRAFIAPDRWADSMRDAVGIE